MMKRSLGMIVAVLAVSAACKKEGASTSEPAASSAATTTATTTANAVAAAAGKGNDCVDGAYKDPGGIYCVKLPAGHTPPKATKKTNTGSEDNFDSEAGYDFTIKYWTPSPSYAFTFEDIKKQDLEETALLKNVSHEDIAGGNGFFSIRHEVEKGGTIGSVYANSVVKRGTMLITCEANYDNGTPQSPPDACKTLRAM